MGVGSTGHCELDDAVARVTSGDREAYRLVVEACEAPVRIVVAAIVPEKHLVEDVVQDAFITAFNKLGDYQLGTNLVAWLKAIARNLALNERRRWCREQRQRGDPRAEAIAAIESEVLAQAVTADDDVIERLRRCVGRLGETARAVVEAFYWSGQTADAIASAHSKTSGWVRVVLHRARAALTDCVADRLGHEH